MNRWKASETAILATIALLTSAFVYALLVEGYWYDGTGGLLADIVKTFDSILPTLGILYLLIVLHRKDYFTVPFLVVLAICTVLILHNLGIYLHLYDHFIDWWDKVAHFIASLVVASIGLLLLLSAAECRRDLELTPAYIVLFTMGFTATFGMLWEVYELWSDEFLGSTMQYLSYNDTMQDIIADLLGAAVVSIGGLLELRRHTPSQIVEGINIDRLIGWFKKRLPI